MALILVTGGAGFVGGHVALRLLADGHRLRCTVRDPARAPALAARLAAAGASGLAERLSVVAADLTRDDGWGAAVAGCDAVMHVASPFPAGLPAHEDDLIVPARDGTLRVLRAARDAGVRRVVVTSSFAAIGYGHGDRSGPFDERDWTDPDGADVQPYMKSKTLAERAAWDFVAREGRGLELAVVAPVGIFGPLLGPDVSASIELVRRFMTGAIPICPRIHFGIVDVRDVADLHVRAMDDPAAAGERFLATAGDCPSLHEVAQMLRRRLGPAASAVPRFQAPDFVVRLAALVSPTARAALPHLGRIRTARATKAREVLGWTPRTSEEAIVATAESLIRLGLL
ncbi:aldehyde reductase [Siculibacillus lacustris]|uniref:Aldehyde reductase n=1 Tax=Siculibacillus lacustris TaxID=1549641 RepID=A0A4Q9VYL2_9HYPH|nr:aldehyde reductase [Siculibacillus lacustris]TBW40293.1 aldehyde reductase [Siculibacillus lacustris]